MPILKLKTLECKVTEDHTGADEAYLKVNGNKVWGPKKMNTNDSKAIDLDFPFTTNISVALYDEDVGGSIDPDDDLGTVVARADQAGEGEQQGAFTRSKASYILYYEVMKDQS